MSKSIEQRPPQVTFAATIIIVGSVMAVLTAWDRVSNLRSLDSRNAVEEFLSEPPGQGLGLQIDDVLAMLHVSGVVAAVCATVTGILGWYVLKGDKASRLVIAVAAVPLFISGMAIGGFASSFVGAAAVMLWLAPAGEWFATGRWTPPPPREEVKREVAKLEDRAAQRPTEFPPAPGAPTEPRPAERPYATAPPDESVAQQFPAEQAGPRHLSPARRPGGVVAAFVITATMTFVVAMVALLAVLLVAAAPDTVMEQLASQPGVEDITLAQVRSSTYVSAGTILVMCVAGLVFAALGLRRHEWARRAWMVAAGLSAVGCVLMIATAPGAGLVAVLPGIAAVITLAMLQRADVRAWYASGPRRGA